MEENIELGIIEAITLKVVMSGMMKIKVGEFVLLTEVLEECCSSFVIRINITVSPNVYGTGIFFTDHGHCCFKSCESCNKLRFLSTGW